MKSSFKIHRTTSNPCFLITSIFLLSWSNQQRGQSGVIFKLTLWDLKLLPGSRCCISSGFKSWVQTASERAQCKHEGPPLPAQSLPRRLNPVSSLYIHHTWSPPNVLCTTDEQIKVDMFTETFYFIRIVIFIHFDQIFPHICV